MHKKYDISTPVFIIGITLMVYANSIQNNFIIDDWRFIVTNDFIKSWHNIFTFFTPDYLKLSTFEIDLQRPVSTISLMIDYRIWGLDPRGYHLSNVILHIFNVIILFQLLKYLGFDNSIPAIGAVLFAVHPINTEAVNAINFREELLVTFFYLLSLLFFTKGLNSPVKKGLLSASIVAYSLALLSKEMAITLPITIFLTHVLLGKKIDKLLEEKWFYFCLSTITAMYLLFLIFLNYPLSKSFASLPDFMRYRYHLNVPTVIGIIGYYLKLCFFPLNLSIEHDFSRFSTIFEARVAVSGLLIISVIVTGLILLKRNYIYGLFALWFFITIIPVCNIFPINDPVAERYLYLPSIGPIILIALLIDFAHKCSARYVLLFLTWLIISFSFLTIQRNADWKNDYTLWKAAVEKNPMNPLAHSSFAKAAFSMGNADEALVELKKAEQLRPNAVTLSNINYNIGLIYKSKFMYDKALYALDKAVRLNPFNALAYVAMGKILRKEGKLSEANNAFRKALEIDPANKEVVREIRLFGGN